jgi:hypothetical protein
MRWRSFLTKPADSNFFGISQLPTTSGKSTLTEYSTILTLINITNQRLNTSIQIATQSSGISDTPEMENAGREQMRATK